VVPVGFDAYARVLHPAEEPGWVSDRLVRWAQVAAWSGMSLRRDAQFHPIALPPARPDREAPWSSQGPREGSLWVDEATARLLSDGKAIVSTSRGTVHARLKRPSRLRRGTLQIRTQGDNGVSGSSGPPLSYRGEEELRDEISFYLTFHVIGLVGG